MSVPAPVIVLLAIVTLAALDSRIAVEFVPSGGVPAPAPITVLPVNVPPAPPSPYWTPLVVFKPGTASGGPIVLPGDVERHLAGPGDPVLHESPSR